MLSESFHEIWIVGELGDEDVEKIKEAIAKRVLKGERRIKIKFYLREIGSLPYLEGLRKVLLENVHASIVVEEKAIDELMRELERSEKKVAILARDPSLSHDLNCFKDKLEFM